jgi:hypothetical protein
MKEFTSLGNGIEDCELQISDTKNRINELTRLIQFKEESKGASKEKDLQEFR